MVLGILNEQDTRVAIVPDVISQIQKMGITVQMVAKAGESAGYSDSLYKAQKVKITTKASVIASSDILITLNPISVADQAKAKASAVLISRYAPFDNEKKISGYAKKSQTIFSLDMIPRVTVAQSADVLSSLGSIAGYRAVLVAAQYLPKYFPMLTTAAGSIPPAKVLVIGAGVAGLQAVATARRLGAVVHVFDTRDAVRDEVKSLGAQFVEIEGATDDKAAGGYAVEQTADYQKRQKASLEKVIQKSDVVITTAQLRGKPAPKLITKKMMEHMPLGGVIVDLASSTGGNCEVTKDKKTVIHKGITVVGNSDLSEEVSFHASLLFSKNILNFFKFLLNEKGKYKLSLEHEVIEKSCIVHAGKKYYK